MAGSLLRAVLLQTLVLGTCLSISSASWFGVWFGLELNLLSMAVLMGVGSGGIPAIKYFLVQASGSLLFLFGALHLARPGGWPLLALAMALMLKVGGGGFHFWLPLVAEALDRVSFLVLLTAQKLAPLAVLSYIWSQCASGVGTWLVFSSIVVGAVGGVNELHLRSLLSFSAINHLGWMLMGMGGGGLIWLGYFCAYVLVLSTLWGPLGGGGYMRLGQVGYGGEGVGLGAGLLSLGGLPPFLGFFPKWAVIQEGLGGGGVAPLVGVLFSAVTLYYYLRLLVCSLVLSGRGGGQWSLLVNGGGGLVGGIFWLSPPL